MSVFIIAELSANHNNDFDLACETISAIAKTGADAVKVQTFRPESLALDVDNEYFGPKKEGAWAGWRPWDLYKQAALPYEWHQPLKELAERLGLVFFSSPFDLEAIDFLETLQVPLYKIASFEINDIPLIQKVAQTGKPIIMSTGVASEADIELAVQTCQAVGNTDITLLKCTSEYPAKLDDANLQTLLELKQHFSVKVGLSDHTMEDLLPIMSVAMGAVVIEKHFILNRNLGGVDSGFSMNPVEFRQMVRQVRDAEKALGRVQYNDSDKNHGRKRSLFAVQDIQPGEAFTEQNVRSLRPNIGIEPKFFQQVLQSRSKSLIKKGDPIYEYFLVY